MTVTPKSRNSVAPQTALEIGGGPKRERSKDGKTTAVGSAKKSRNDSLNKNVGRKTEQTGRDERRKCGRDKTLGRERSRSKGNKKEEINQTLPLDAGSGT